MGMHTVHNNIQQKWRENEMEETNERTEKGEGDEEETAVPNIEL